MAIAVPHRTRGALVADGIYAPNAGVKVKKIEIGSTPTGAEQDTGFDLPAKGVVIDVLVDVTTAEVTGAVKTIDVGLLSSESGGDADGLHDGTSTASAGLQRSSLLGGAQTRGALMREIEEGTVFVPSSHVMNGTARSVTYTAGSGDWAQFRGAIYITYLDLDGI